MNPSAPSRCESRGPSAIALLLWLLAQGAALAAAADRIPVSARSPQPPEAWAAVQMLAVQFAFSALLFPVMLRGWAGTAIGVATAWPMLQLAGFLAAVPAAGLAAAGGFLSLWIGGLGLWNGALPTEKSKLLGVAAASLATLGTPLLCYLRIEFAQAGSGIGIRSGPIGAAALLLDQPGNPAAWGAITLFFLGGLAAALWQNRRRNRAFCQI